MGSARSGARSAGLLCWAALAGAAAAGCDGGDAGAPAPESLREPGEGGTLVWAVADPVASVDPLTAATRAERLAARQIHEPLAVAPSGPGARRSEALLRSLRPRADGTRWQLRLRPRVRFADGSPLSSTAVLANARRWLTTAAGRRALPGLGAADAPRPGLVRLFFSSPQPDVPKLLARPRLGLVSPAALRPSSGEAASVRRGLLTGSGTGAFELRERDRASALLARNTTWWGARNRAPSLDQVRFETVPVARERLEALLAGEVQLADELGTAEARTARQDPLLTTLPAGRGAALGMERSVRGVSSGRAVPYLARAWLTDLQAGG